MGTRVSTTFFLFLLGVMTDVAHAQQSCTPSACFYCPSSTGLAMIYPPGYYCTGGPQNDHIACPKDTFNPSMGGSSLTSACMNCPRFQITSAVGSTACAPCGAGTYYSDNGGDGPAFGGTCTVCSAGTASIVNSTSCSSCLPGTFSNAATQTCSTCRPGSYQNQPGAVQCIACPSGTYTFVSPNNGSSFTPVWGASSLGQCVNLPTSGYPLICLPGTYMSGGSCLPCPIGYYCPSMQIVQSDSSAVRACPGGTMSSQVGAISANDCSVSSVLLPYLFDACSIAPGGSGAMNGLRVTSSVASLSTDTLLFTTSTAVYRVFLQETTLEAIAGSEGTSANGAAANAVGASALFTSLSAIGVDYDAPEATLIVVGDGRAVRMINVFSRQVRQGMFVTWAKLTFFLGGGR